MKFYVMLKVEFDTALTLFGVYDTEYAARFDCESNGVIIDRVEFDRDVVVQQSTA